MSSELSIRQARADDVYDIVEMLADDVYGAERERVEQPVPSSYLEAFSEIDSDANNELLVAVLDGAAVGVFQLTFVPGLSYQGGRRAMVEGVRVARDYRSRGIGRKLMLYAIRRAKERGCVLIELSSNAGRAGAHRFYERLGFVASHVGMKLKL